jgi:hypothetical protein
VERSDVDGHLALVIAAGLLGPSQIQNRLNGAVRQLCGEIVVGAVQRHERLGEKVQPGRRTAQVIGQPTGQRRLAGAGDRQRLGGLRRLGVDRDPAETALPAEEVAGPSTAGAPTSMTNRGGPYPPSRQK